MNKKQAVKKADELFSKEVRSVGYCEAQHITEPLCLGELQCAHIRSRRYMAIRWDRTNAVCLCGQHADYFTGHPLEWEEFVVGLRGPYAYDRLRQKGLNNPPQDPFEVIERLRAATS